MTDPRIEAAIRYDLDQSLWLRSWGDDFDAWRAGNPQAYEYRVANETARLAFVDAAVVGVSEPTPARKVYVIESGLYELRGIGGCVYTTLEAAMAEHPNATWEPYESGRGWSTSIESYGEWDVHNIWEMTVSGPVVSEQGVELICHRCGGPNISWDAPSPLWNQVMRGGSINGPQEYDEIICPTCFAVLAEERGAATGWTLDARAVHVELETVTPSGRVWDAGKRLWVDPSDVPTETPAPLERHPDSASLVERVAEAIFQVEYPKHSAMAADDSNRWSWGGLGHAPEVKRVYRLYAAAAIAALTGLDTAVPIDE